MKNYTIEYDNETEKGKIVIDSSTELRFTKSGKTYSIPILNKTFIGLNKMKTYIVETLLS